MGVEQGSIPQIDLTSPQFISTEGLIKREPSVEGVQSDGSRRELVGKETSVDEKKYGIEDLTLGLGFPVTKQNLVRVRMKFNRVRKYDPTIQVEYVAEKGRRGRTRISLTGDNLKEAIEAIQKPRMRGRRAIKPIQAPTNGLKPPPKELTGGSSQNFVDKASAWEESDEQGLSDQEAAILASFIYDCRNKMSIKGIPALSTVDLPSRLLRGAGLQKPEDGLSKAGLEILKKKALGIVRHPLNRMSMGDNRDVQELLMYLRSLVTSGYSEKLEEVLRAHIQELAEQQKPTLDSASPYLMQGGRKQPPAKWDRQEP